MFSLEERMDFVRRTFADEPKIEVTSYEGMTIEFCRSIGVKFMLRGLRNPSDFEFEKAIAQTNRRLCPDIETVFLLTSSGYSFISSSIVREILDVYKRQPKDKPKTGDSDGQTFNITLLKSVLRGDPVIHLRVQTE